MIPTQILAPPYDTGDVKEKARIYPTDAGEMTLDQLAEATGLKRSTIAKRIYDRGWSHIGIFMPLHHKHNNRLDSTDSEGSAYWQSLSNQPRTHNFKKLPVCSAFENRYFPTPEACCEEEY